MKDSWYGVKIIQIVLFELISLDWPIILKYIYVLNLVKIWAKIVLNSSFSITRKWNQSLNITRTKSKLRETIVSQLSSEVRKHITILRHLKVDLVE